MTGLITLERELMDDRVSSIRMPNARVRKDAAPLVRGDGASAFDHYPAAERNYRQAYFANDKQETNKPSFPFISKQYAKDIWRIPVYWGISKIFEPLVNATSGSTDKGTQIMNAFLGMAYNWSGQLSNVHFRNAMPKIAAWRGFARGQSDMKEMYSIDVGGFEMPVFVYDANPVELIKKNFTISPDGQYVISRFNRKLGDFCKRTTWLQDGAAAKYTRGDYKELIDASLANDWFAREFTWDMQQFGPITATGNVGPFSVNKYGRASTMGIWFRNMVGDKVYDALDIPFDMLGPAGLGVISRGAQQVFKDSEYKAISAVRRSLIQSPRKNLQYDLKISYVQAHAPAIYTILTT